MGEVPAPLDFAAIDLVWSALSLTLIKKGATYIFYFPQHVRSPCPNYLDRYLVPPMISLPNFYQSKGLEARRLITQFYIGKDLRSTEEGVDIKSTPRVVVGPALGLTVYALTTGSFRG